MTAADTMKYLGFEIVIHDERHLTIYTPERRLIFMGRMGIATARNVIRGYRAERLREQQEVVA